LNVCDVANLKLPAIKAFPSHYGIEGVIERIVTDDTHCQGGGDTVGVSGRPLYKSHEVVEKGSLDLIFAGTLGGCREGAQEAHADPAEKNETTGQRARANSRIQAGQNTSAAAALERSGRTGCP